MASATASSPDLWSLVCESVERFADREAYRVDGAPISYARFADRVSALSLAIDPILEESAGEPNLAADQGLIAALLPNDHPLFELYFTAAVTRAVLLPVNTRLSAPEITRLFAVSRPSVLVIDSRWHALLEAVTLPESLACVVWVGEVMPLSVDRPLYSLSYEALVEDPVQHGNHYQPRNVTAAGELAVEIFNTSGTTGVPKMVPHTHANVSHHVAMTLDALELTGDRQECWGHFGPMYHVGDVAFVWAGVAIGARHVFHPQQLRFEDVARVMAEEGVTITKLVPTMLRFLAQSSVVRELDFAALRWILTGGDHPERALVERIEAAFGCQFIQGYGMTEATCHVAFRNESAHDGEGGLNVLPGLEVRILDETGAALPSGQVGEIAIRGPNVFGGYLANADENRRRFTADGFFRSGDLGRLDDDGLLWVSGRLKDMIIVGGENVFARDVEEVANTLPSVRASAAVGLPDATFGEVVALAVTGDDDEPDPETLIRRLRAHLAGFKVPRHVFVFDAFPMTPTGKVRKDELRDVMRQRLEAAAVRQRQRTDDGRSVAARVRDVLTRTVGELLETSDPGRSLLDLNVDSLGMSSLILDLEAEFDLSLPHWFMLEYDSLDALVGFFERPTVEQQAVLARSAVEFESHGPEGDGEVAPAEPDRRPAGQVLLGALLQSAGLLLRPGLALFSLLPPVWAAVYVVAQLGFGVGLLLAPAFLLASSFLAMVFLIAAKWLLVGRLRPGEYELGTPFFYRWLMVHNLFKSLTPFLGAYRGTALLHLFYRLCGARLGPGCVIHTLFIAEPELVSIGANTVIERKANLQPSLVAGGRLRLGTIEIGAHSAVGFSASLGPGTRVGDDAYVPVLASSADAAREGVGAPTGRGVGRVAAGLSYLALGYLCGAALLITFFLTEALIRALGVDLATFHFYGPLQASAIVLGAAALARFGLLPAVYFLLVVLIKRLLLVPLKPGLDWDAQGSWRRYGNWLYGRMIDVPFFDWALALTNMSALTVLQFRLLGARIGRRVFFSVPYTTEPELLRLADETMIAGNVSLFPANRGRGRVDTIELARGAAVANSAVLHGGTRLGRDSLLGDLSVTPAGFVLQPGAIAVGNPPRIVSRTDFDGRALKGFRFVASQCVLVALQLAFGLGATVMSWIALTPVIGLLAKTGPHWWEFPTIGPLLLLTPSVFTLAAIPVAKLLFVPRFAPGDYPLFGWLYVRWALLEALLGRVEESVTSQFNGTVFSRILYESMGARVGESACLMGSPIGGEFDLKEIGAGAALNFQSKIFAHSIKRHSLIFEAAKVEQDATVRPFAIVEAGAIVRAGGAIGDAVAFHAARDASGKAPYEKRYLNLRELEAIAARTLPADVFDYFAGGAADGTTLERNETIYSRYLLVPRVLRDVSEVSTTRHFLDMELGLPLMVAPMAMQKLAHRDGETGMARAASRLGIPYVLSCLATTAVGEVADAARRGNADILFQCYCFRDRRLVETMIRRAERAGARALVLTVDAPVSGKRERDLRNRFAMETDIRFPNLEGLTGAAGFGLAQFDQEIDPTLKWDVLAWFRERTPLPVVLKGILSAEDAKLAVEHGAAGIIVSNHGGRQLDTTPAAIEVLPEIRAAVRPLAGNYPIFIDGGIRRGTDVFKVIALGADGVLVGRPCVYGLAVDGYAGVARALTILREELLQTMRLAGCRSLDEIVPDMVRIANGAGEAGGN